jgi:hypothetical protein
VEQQIPVEELVDKVPEQHLSLLLTGTGRAGGSGIVIIRYKYPITNMAFTTNNK